MKIILASSSLGRKKILESLGLKFEVIPANIDEEKFKAKTPLALVKKIARAKALAVARILDTKRMAAYNFRHPHTDASANSHSKDSVLVQKTMDNPRQSGVRKFVTASIFPCLIIAADSMVVFGGKTYGKPKSRKEAKRLLKRLSGNTHQFITGLCVMAFSDCLFLPHSSPTLEKSGVLKPKIDTNIHKLYQSSVKTQVTFEKFTDKEIDNYVQTSEVTSHAGAYSTDDELIKQKVKLVGSETNVVGLPLEKLIPILREIQLKSPG